MRAHIKQKRLRKKVASYTDKYRCECNAAGGWLLKCFATKLECYKFSPSYPPTLNHFLIAFKGYATDHTTER